ncbi:MAG TPA: DUF3105 domain-containing protein [Anaerolineae bacterium]|nr:DUF3105 domain-containing protein [Anaerolineae bacterium]
MAKTVSRRVRPAEGNESDRTKLIIAGSIGVGLLILGVLLYLAIRPEPGLEGLVNYGRLQTNQHDADIEYEYGALPPYGGVHNPLWQQCGIYDTPIQSEYAIHSLEHGVVWLTYQEDLSAEDVEYLAEHARGQSHMLMSPYPNQQSPVVLTAWGLQMEVESLPDDRIERFIQQYQQGPQTPERGASCGGANAVGDPVEQ